MASEEHDISSADNSIESRREPRVAPSRNERVWLLLLVDGLFSAASLMLAYLLRFDFQFTGENTYYLSQFFWFVTPVVALRLAIFLALKHYRAVTIYSSITEMVGVAKAVGIGSLALLILNPFIVLIPSWGAFELGGESLRRIPWAVLYMESVLSFLLIGLARIWPRVYLIYFADKKDTEKRIAIIGANRAGVNAGRILAENPASGYRPVAFIDNDPALANMRISGIPVRGGIENLHEVIDLHDVDEILIALPEATPQEMREIVKECEKARLKFRRIPSVDEVMSGRVTVNQLRPVSVEDLLGRPPVELMLEPERNYIQGERVLITGAGGSIGAELCRQALRNDPEVLILMGRGENSVFEISSELGYDYKTDQVRLVIGDIRDKDKVRWVFETYEPTIVFHAAAHKHVPLMELHPDEAVLNNVIGTWKLARMASQAGAKKFILISTDKAVRPTNVMGASKRMAEKAVQLVAQESDTVFHIVRFGNVLGSRGSVIPLMQRQVRAGGPVTVTHPDVTRYFMTIPEAVSLVLRAGSFDEKNQLFLLDMGQPVKILDLARNIITLSGLEPEVDIPIVFTGLRPGEKLYEELLTQGEGVRKTELGKLFVVERENVDSTELTATFEALTEAAQAKDGARVRSILKECVPDFQPNASLR